MNRVRDLIVKSNRTPEDNYKLRGESWKVSPRDFVLVEPGTDWVWFVTLNDASGDDWSLNNVDFGGFGAVGRRAQRSDELNELLEVLQSTLPPDAKKLLR